MDQFALVASSDRSSAAWPATTTASGAGENGVHVYASCRRAADMHRVRAIREWLHKTDERYCRGRIASVAFSDSIESAIDNALGDGRQSLVLTLGYSAEEVRESCRGRTDGLDEPVICDRSSSEQGPSRASASAVDVPDVVFTSMVFEAVRKALVRIRARQFGSVRILSRTDEIEASLRLRYDVWKEKGYLAPERESPRTPWEVDYTDRNAVVIGLFDAHGTLAGCARLVREMGPDRCSYAAGLESLLARARDPVLLRNYNGHDSAGRASMRQPFDVLEEFAGFRDIYRRYVKERTPVAELSRVVLAPKHRGRGFGEVLVDSLVSIARRNGIEVLFLACRETSAPFYRHCGFETVEGMRSEAFLDIPDASVIMFNELGRQGHA